MGLSNFEKFKSFSNEDLLKESIKSEKQLFDLYFKKATRQSFKSHEIKKIKRTIAQLKTLLTIRLNEKPLT